MDSESSMPSHEEAERIRNYYGINTREEPRSIIKEIKNKRLQYFKECGRYPDVIHINSNVWKNIVEETIRYSPFHIDFDDIDKLTLYGMKIDVNDDQETEYKMTNKSGLLPCPFCGSEAEIRKVRCNGGWNEGYDDWVIACTRCSCRKEYPADGYYDREFMSEEECKEDWNRRI